MEVRETTNNIKYLLYFNYFDFEFRAKLKYVVRRQSNWPQTNSQQKAQKSTTYC